MSKLRAWKNTKQKRRLGAGKGTWGSEAKAVVVLERLFTLLFVISGLGASPFGKFKNKDIKIFLWSSYFLSSHLCNLLQMLLLTLSPWHSQGYVSDALALCVLNSKERNAGNTDCKVEVRLLLLAYWRISKCRNTEGEAECWCKSRGAAALTRCKGPTSDFPEPKHFKSKYEKGYFNYSKVKRVWD